MGERIPEDESRLLTPGAFEVVLDNELRRAVRSQSFVTLVLLETSREWEDMRVTADEGTVREVATIVEREVRDTDLLGMTRDGALALVLIGADFDGSTSVIDRLMTQIDHYGFTTPLRISLGAACYPTHAVDAVALQRQAASRPLVNWRGGPSAPQRSN